MIWRVPASSPRITCFHVSLSLGRFGTSPTPFSWCLVKRAAYSRAAFSFSWASSVATLAAKLFQAERPFFDDSVEICSGTPELILEVAVKGVVCFGEEVEEARLGPRACTTEVSEGKAEIDCDSSAVNRVRFSDGLMATGPLLCCWPCRGVPIGCGGEVRWEYCG